MNLTRRLLVAGGFAGLALRPVFASDAPDAPSAPSLARPAIPVRSVAALHMEDADGTPVPLSSYAGDLVVLNLWAPWCLPCRREMPSFARLADRLSGQGVHVLPLAFSRRGTAGVRRFYRDIGIDNLPILIGDGDNLKSTLGIEILPITLILDGAANHIATVAGEATWDDDATLAWIAGLG